MRDRHSPLVQAADVMGNFAMSWLFRELGDNSKKRTKRAKLFHKVFGDIMDSFNAAHDLELAGQNDLQLRDAAAGQVRLRLYWEKT